MTLAPARAARHRNTMPLHLQKLCVGADSVEDLRRWIEARLAEKRARGVAAEHIHTTRMMPKRTGDLLDGGSLYWVVRGAIQVRQRLLDIRTATGADGITRCELVLDPELVETELIQRRPFQGWRYLAHEDRPQDRGAVDRSLPPELYRELRTLGLL
jgi:hypothetical protein